MCVKGWAWTCRKNKPNRWSQLWGSLWGEGLDKIAVLGLIASALGGGRGLYPGVFVPRAPGAPAAPALGFASPALFRRVSPSLGSGFMG